MRSGFVDGLMKKCMKVRRAGHVNGTVKLHFHSPKVPDVDLNSSEPVDLFQLIGVTEQELMRSNIQQLLESNVLQFA